MSYKDIEALNKEIEILRLRNIELELANCELYGNIADLKIQMIDQETALKHLDFEAQEWINAKIASLPKVNSIYQ